MAEPTCVAICTMRREFPPVRWIVYSDTPMTTRFGRSQTIAEALVAVQLAIDEMGETK